MLDVDGAAQMAEACIACGEEAASRTVETQQFAWADGAQEILLQAEVPVWHCAACGDTYLAEGGEEAQHEAVCRHLGRLTPEDIRQLRGRHGLSQAALAERTGIGIASIKRWERGLIIQNASLDARLRLVDQGEIARPRVRSAPVFQTEFRSETIEAARQFRLRPMLQAA